MEQRTLLWISWNISIRWATSVCKSRRAPISFLMRIRSSIFHFCEWSFASTSKHCISPVSNPSQDTKIWTSKFLNCRKVCVIHLYSVFSVRSLSSTSRDELSLNIRLSCREHSQKSWLHRRCLQHSRIFTYIVFLEVFVEPMDYNPPLNCCMFQPPCKN